MGGLYHNYRPAKWKDPMSLMLLADFGAQRNAVFSVFTPGFRQNPENPNYPGRP